MQTALVLAKATDSLPPSQLQRFMTKFCDEFGPIKLPQSEASMHLNSQNQSKMNPLEGFARLRAAFAFW